MAVYREEAVQTLAEIADSFPGDRLLPLATRDRARSAVRGMKQPLGVEIGLYEATLERAWTRILDAFGVDEETMSAYLDDTEWEAWKPLQGRLWELTARVVAELQQLAPTGCCRCHGEVRGRLYRTAEEAVEAGHNGTCGQCEEVLDDLLYMAMLP